MRADDIKIRDPFVLPFAADGCYHLFGTTDLHPWGDVPGVGFDVYRSRDLLEWEGPFPAYRPPANFWGTHCFWAPEVHPWRGRFYMFASFHSPTVLRGTAILAAEHPLGPYRPHSGGAVTPADSECLDGTLWVAPDGVPWMIFSRDWPLIDVGRYSAMPLTDDLRAAAGVAIELFPVNAAPWVESPPWQKTRDGEGKPLCFVADGAWPFELRDGGLGLLFSSWSKGEYATGLARSRNGEIAGPWEFNPLPFFPANGGHAMMFEGFDGQSYLTLHQPNDPPPEHPRFFPVEQTSTGLVLGEPLAG
jgi:hypothetical protein